MRQIVVDNISTTYFITEDGQCYNSITGKFLKGQVEWNGYKSYLIRLPNGKTKRLKAHRLVAAAYVDNPLHKPEVNHLDGNKLNNCADNLEWVTSREIKENIELPQHVFCFTKDKRLVAQYRSIAEASRSVHISPDLISQELRKPIKALTGGFYWADCATLGETKTYTNCGKAKPVNQYDLGGRFIMSYPSTGIAAKALGISASHIGECCRGKLKTYKRYIWRYVEDIVSTSDESQSAPQEQ